MANLTSLLWLLTCEVLHCHSPAALPLIIPQYFYFRVFYSVSKVLIVTSLVLAFSSDEPLFICRYQINLSRVMVGNFFRETNWFSSILGMHFPVKVNIIDHKSTCFYLLWVLSKVNNYIGILSWKQSVKNTQQYMGRWYVIKY